MTPGVIGVVGVGKTPKQIDEREITDLQIAVSSGLPSEPWPFLEVGEKVQISGGALTGVEGILINFKGNHRVVLSVSLLRRSVAMEVDLAWVVRLERSPKSHSRHGVVHPVANPSWSA